MAFNGGLFGTFQIGDYAFVDASDTPLVIIESIPRAIGVVIKFLGGGEQVLTLNAWIINFAGRRRKELEEFFRDLAGNLLNESPATLLVNGVIYTNCFYNGFSVGGSGHHFDTFSISFLRSSGDVC